MGIKFTNDTGINLPMCVWLMNDPYDHIQEENYISATTLLRPIREIVLTMQNKKEDRAYDVSNFIKSRLGQSLHDSIERAWDDSHSVIKACKLVGIPEEIADRIRVNPEPGTLKEGEIPVYMEKRTIREIDGFKIGGKFDLVMAGDLHDYKSTGTYSYIKQSNADKYIKQGSIYRWLNPEMITNDILTINYLFTDWVSWKVDSPNYPPFPVMEQHFPLMSYEETETFIRQKLKQISFYADKPKEELPLCTDEELWKDPPVYKYFKKADAQRATKVCENALEAQNLVSQGGGVVKVVEGMAKACNYCAAMPFCNQALDLKKAGLLP